ncbi:MAG: hypothetical protein WC378_20510, partial [Opitutaceae bacterium]
GEFAIGGAGAKSIGIAEKGVKAAIAASGVRTALQPERVADALIAQKDNGETGATAILKAYGDAYIENLSETAGGAVPSILKKMPFGGKLLNAMTDLARKTGMPENELIRRISTKAGWNGLLGEWGEERLNTAMKSVTDIDDFGAGKDSTPLQRLAAGMQQDLQVQNQLVELGVLSIPGATKFIAGKALGSTGPRQIDEGLTSGAILGEASTVTEGMKQPEPGRKTSYENEQPKPQTTDEFAAKMRKDQGVGESPVAEGIQVELGDTLLSVGPDGRLIQTKPPEQLSVQNRPQIQTSVDESTQPVTEPVSVETEPSGEENPITDQEVAVERDKRLARQRDTRKRTQERDDLEDDLKREHLSIVDENIRVLESGERDDDIRVDLWRSRQNEGVDSNEIPATEGMAQPWEQTIDEWLSGDTIEITPGLSAEESRGFETIRGPVFSTPQAAIGYAKAKGWRGITYNVSRDGFSPVGCPPGNDARSQSRNGIRYTYKLSVQDAVRRGESVSRNVLEQFQGEPWADAALAKLQSENIPTIPPVPVKPTDTNPNARPQTADGPAPDFIDKDERRALQPVTVQTKAPDQQDVSIPAKQPSGANFDTVLKAAVDLNVFREQQTPNTLHIRLAQELGFGGQEQDLFTLAKLIQAKDQADFDSRVAWDKHAGSSGDSWGNKAKRLEAQVIKLDAQIQSLASKLSQGRPVQESRPVPSGSASVKLNKPTTERTDGTASGFISKEERKALQSLGYPISEISTMDIADARRRIQDGIRKEAAESAASSPGQGDSVAPVVAAREGTTQEPQAAEEVTGDARIKEIDGKIKKIRSIPFMLDRDLTSKEKASIRALEQERDQIVSGKASVSETAPSKQVPVTVPDVDNGNWLPSDNEIVVGVTNRQHKINAVVDLVNTALDNGDETAITDLLSWVEARMPREQIGTSMVRHPAFGSQTSK